MKVISEIASLGVLVEMSAHEFREITGETTGSLYHSQFNRDILGKNFNLKPVFAKIAALPKALNTIVEAQIELRRIADLIEPVKSMVEKVTGA